MTENKPAAQPGGGAVLYEIRKDGITCGASYRPLCGYDRQTLAEMREAGYELFADGKRVKFKR